MKKLSLLLLVLFSFGFYCAAIAQQTTIEYDERTPFSKVIYKNNHPYIEVDQQWVKLRSIEGHLIEDFIEIAVDMRATAWEKRFHRDMHAIMDVLGIERGEHLKVTYEKDGTIASRQFELKITNSAESVAFHDSIVASFRVQRILSPIIPSNLKYLNRRLDGYEKGTAKWLSPAEVIHDLEHLEWQIDNNYSYAELTDFDYKQALDVIQHGIGEGISQRDFAYQLKCLMANFGDGHSRVSMRYVLKKEEKKYLPFTIIQDSGKFYAINPAERSFWKNEYPEVMAINDIEIGELFNLAEEMIAKSTPKFIAKSATDYLNRTALILKIAGVADISKAKVTFGSRRRIGKRQSLKEWYKLDRHRFEKVRSKYLLKDSLIEDNIGFIAMNERMSGDDDFIKSLHQMMKKFKNTDGLIIDIRDNGGGRRDPLLALLPYFTKETKVTNVARYRIDKDKNLNPKHGYLEKRFMLPESIDSKFFQKESDKKMILEFQEAVAKFKNYFKPSRIVSDEKFSEYHFMTVHPNRENGVYYYDKPVVVLIDEGCFSASDIFAAGIRQGDQVTLLGNTTGGGSGFSESRLLPNSGIKVKLSRMFSYQPDGNLYDGHGVEPDIELDYTLNDRLGQTDGMLERAKTFIGGE